jgi:hypothetical protein
MVASWCGHLPIVTWLSPDSLSGRAIAHSGPIGGTFMLVLFVASVVAVLDVIVNDIMPPRYRLAVMDRRHIGYMGMSLSLLMIAGVVGARVGPTPLLLSYVLPAMFAAGVTWLDLFARHQYERRSPYAVPL